ncbi:MAG: hypothetical protein ACKOCK_07475, partial [Chloroflexota bacterium]
MVQDVEAGFGASGYTVLENVPMPAAVTAGRLRGRSVLSDGDVDAAAIADSLATGSWLKALRARGIPHP